MSAAGVLVKIRFCGHACRLSYLRGPSGDGRSSMKIASILMTACTAFLAAGCARQAPAPAAAPPYTAPFKPVASIIDLMAEQVDPAADFLWDSVATISGPKGTEERQPRTDAEWNAVRRQALLLIEGANLLMVEGRVGAHPGQKLEAAPGPGDYTPDQAQAEINAHRPEFDGFALGLLNAGTEALRAIETRNVDAYLEAGGEIDEACEACHKRFWYPGGGAPPPGK
jgi:cytochrome c556